MRIGLCILNRVHVPYDFFERVTQLVKLAAEHGHQVAHYGLCGCSLLAQGRSYLTTRALNDGSDVVLWIDDDSIFKPVDALSLCSNVQSIHGMLGAAFSQRRVKGITNVQFLEESINHPIKFFEEGCILEVKSLGFGLVAINAQALQQLRDDLPIVKSMFDDGTIYPFFKEHIEGNQWLGEDVSFCRRLRLHGLKIFLDTRIRAGHRGEYDYQIEDTLGAVPRLDTLTLNFQR